MSDKTKTNAGDRRHPPYQEAPGLLEDENLLNDQCWRLIGWFSDNGSHLSARAWNNIKGKIREIIRAHLPADLAAPSAPRLTAYEAQVLIGTSVNGCNMSPDRVFDLPAAWVRLHALGLIDRCDGLAIITDAGRVVVAKMLSGKPCTSAPAEVEGLVERHEDGCNLLGGKRGNLVIAGLGCTCSATALTALQAEIERLRGERDAWKANAEGLAVALKVTRDDLLSALHSEFDGVWSEADFDEESASADAALAAYAKLKGDA